MDKERNGTLGVVIQIAPSTKCVLKDCSYIFSSENKKPLCFFLVARLLLSHETGLMQAFPLYQSLYFFVLYLLLKVFHVTKPPV